MGSQGGEVQRAARVVAVVQEGLSVRKRGVRRVGVGVWGEGEAVGVCVCMQFVCLQPTLHAAKHAPSSQPNIISLQWTHSLSDVHMALIAHTTLT